ncbi:alpha/beta hydrolase-fold protein, partial [Endozoicomonas sp.]|nr:alpha/beta hydrolase-fold protein [Endozoicomonas sp.]
LAQTSFPRSCQCVSPTSLIEQHFPVSEQRAISGHSMGGHGALMIALRNPERYCSVSAFSPISSPSRAPWGKKAFNGYLGSDCSQWLLYDSCELMKNAGQQKQLPILVDQGSDDEFLKEQLQPDSLKEAANTSHYPLTLRMQPSYDHSYYFIASFIDEHLHFHSQHLRAPETIA